MVDMLINPFRSSEGGLGLASIAAFALLSACTPANSGSGLNDPYEKQNRTVHRFNLAFDSTLFGNRTQKGIIPTIPKPITIGFSNFASNLAMPSTILNDLLQLKLAPAGQNTLRFALNTTVGIGGLFDPAGVLGIDAKKTDFGETLYVWGVPEGAYLEIPLLGPSTERDWAGTLVDVAINPVNTVLKAPDRAYATGAILTAKAGNRQRFADTYESILYDSADSYAQSRLIYLQNRHYSLGVADDSPDPTEDPYAQ